jgi:protein TonB
MRAVGSSVLAVLLAAGCRGKREDTVTLPVERQQVQARGEEPPVPLDPELSVEYPAALLHQGITGTVLLRLFVDQTGRLVPDSTRLQESSGYPALDSAALAGAAALRFAPALRNGVAVATPFIQPIRFRPPPTDTSSPPG